MGDEDEADVAEEDAPENDDDESGSLVHEFVSVESITTCAVK